MVQPLARVVRGKRKDAGEEALGPERRGHAGRRRPPQKPLVLLKYQDILDIGMRPHVGPGHRGSVSGEYDTPRVSVAHVQPRVIRLWAFVTD